MLIDRRLVTNFDWKLVTIILLIPIMGIVILYSAGFNPVDTIRLVEGSLFNIEIKSIPAFKQFIYILVGFFVMIIVSSIPTDFFKKYAYVFYIITLVTLVAV